jgi:lysophospholipase L1-like esterase
MNKIRILCFGDSYTWGYIPGSNHERFSEEIRFTKVLQKLLGSAFEVIEEGLNSRTLISDDQRPGKEGRNGSSYLIPCLDSHDPLDLVIIMLGTNELKDQFNNSAEIIGDLFEKHFVKVIVNRKSQFQDKCPQLLIISLPIINESTEYAIARYKGGAEKAAQTNKIYAEISKANNCYFVDVSSLKVGIDGVHLTKESQIKLAEMLYDKIKLISF